MQELFGALSFSFAIFVFGHFCVFKKIFCGNAKFRGGICIRGGLLWPFVVFYDLSVQSATSVDTAVFCGYL